MYISIDARFTTYISLVCLLKQKIYRNFTEITIVVATNREIAHINCDINLNNNKTNYNYYLVRRKILMKYPKSMICWKALNTETA